MTDFDDVKTGVCDYSSHLLTQFSFFFFFFFSFKADLASFLIFGFRYDKSENVFIKQSLKATSKDKVVSN